MANGSHLVYSNYVQSMFSIAVLLKACDLCGAAFSHFERTILCGLALRNRSDFPKDFSNELEGLSQNSKVICR